MSRIFEALRQSGEHIADPASEVQNAEVVRESPISPHSLEDVASFTIASTSQARMVTLSDEHGLAAEKVRVLATKIRHMSARRQLRRLLVTSSMKGEGKSLISANLAITLAKSARARVLLLDGDLRQPTLHEKLGCKCENTLANWWKEEAPLSSILYKEKDLPLWLLPAANFPEQPLELLQSARLSELLTQLNEFFDWIVIDSPPMVPLADTPMWASMSDGVLLVVRERFTQVELLNRALEAIESKKLLGLVMNDSSISESRYFPAYYQYAAKQPDKESAATPMA